MEQEIQEALEMIANGKLPPRSMMDDLAGTAASLTILRAAAAENPGLARQLEKMMEVVNKVDRTKEKGTKTKFEKAIVETVTQGDTNLWDNIKGAYTTAAQEIDSDIGGRSLFERLTTASEVGVITGVVAGAAGYIATKTYAGTVAARAALLSSVAAQDLQLGKALIAASKAKDYAKIVELRFPGVNAQFKADALADLKSDPKFAKRVISANKAVGKQIVAHAGKGALLSAKFAARSARILAVAATVGMYAGIAGGIIGGVVAYTTMPEVEAGMRKAAAGVRVAAGETYKMIKEETNEIVEAAMLLGDSVAVQSAKDFQKKALTKARDAAKATVEAADTLGQGIISAWGAAKNAAMATIAVMDPIALSDAYTAAKKARVTNNLNTIEALGRPVLVLSGGPMSNAEVADLLVGGIDEGTTTYFASDRFVSDTKKSIAADKSIEETGKERARLTSIANKVATASSNMMTRASLLWEAASNLVSESSDKTAEKAEKAGKIWVEGYDKTDGSKVKGFWRKMSDTVFGNEVSGIEAIKQGLQ